MDATTAIIVAVTGLVAGLGGIITALNTARNAAKESEMARMTRIVDELQEQNDRLSKRVSLLEQEVVRYQRWAAALVHQVIGAGLIPERLEPPSDSAPTQPRKEKTNE